MADEDRDFETIRVEREGSVARVVLDRPDVHNAFDARMQEELRRTWRSLRHDDEIRCVVLTAAGDAAFCVGIDRNQDFSAIAGGAGLFGTSNDFMYDDPGNDLGPKSCDLWKPVVGAVNGMACGGAFYMLAECDVIIAAEHATFFDPHVTYGMAAVFEPMKMLQRMPLGEVLRMTLLGSHEHIGAETALRIGLVSEVVPASELRTRAGWIAESIASQPPSAVQASLRAIWAANEMSPSAARQMGPAIYAAGFDAEAIREGSERFRSGERIDPRVR